LIGAERKMTRKVTVCLLLILALPFAGCRSRTDRSEGSVILSISAFNQLPFQVSATNGPFTIPSLTLSNIPKDPTGTTSSLQTIELRRFEVVYTRRDTGRTTPPVLAESIFGNVPVNGQLTINNQEFLSSNQTLNPPLLDLVRRGVDSETGSAVVVLDVSMRFFGRTLAGDDIVSQPASFTIEVTQ
jgi:hypothetical protein